VCSEVPPTAATRGGGAGVTTAAASDVSSPLPPPLWRRCGGAAERARRRRAGSGEAAEEEEEEEEEAPPPVARAAALAAAGAGAAARPEEGGRVRHVPRPRRAAQKHAFPVSRAEVDAVIACEADAAAPLIRRLFDFLTPQARGGAATAAAGALDGLRCVRAALCPRTRAVRRARGAVLALALRPYSIVFVLSFINDKRWLGC
jgi:hypothetical protein